jgi:RNA polymerase sigma factor (sigma-70 family)
MPTPDSSFEGSKHRSFATTRWSLVRAAGAEDSAARHALETLCAAYWYPLYAYVRRRGHQPAQAQDLTQAFFAQLLEGNVFAVANEERGRFRSFLLKSLTNFLAGERRREAAQKRGGGLHIHSIDFAAGEDRYRHEPADTATPERLFERRWALTLLEQTLARLRGEHETTGRAALFAALEPHLHGRDSGAYAEIAARLHTSEGAVKVAAHRLRRRYREILREEIAETVAAAEDVDEELRELLRTLAS